jgi:predicted type IV restriction endonuclease
MKSSEECLQAFLRLKGDLPNYPLSSETEADTRARLIDRVLGEVLDWPPENINREEHAHPGYMDYVLLVSRRTAVLEAKKSGDTFQLPHDITSGKTFTLNGIISKVANLQLHINQVMSYCFNNGIEYAIVSNGLQYVVFRAVRVDGIHVGRGRVLVFNGFDDIETRFVSFWELLSKSGVESNSLPRHSRILARPFFSTAASLIKSTLSGKR